MKSRLMLYKMRWLVTFLWLLIWPIGSWAQPPGGMPPPTVVVVPVVEAELESSLYLVGTAYPLIATTISAQVEGNIQRFNIDEGTFVEDGETICQLDKTLRLIDIKRAKAQLEQARAKLLKLQAGTREEEINQAKAQLENRKAILEKLKLNKERMEDLFSKGMVTLEQKQNAHWDHEQGLAQLHETEAILNMAVNGPRSEDIAAASATAAIHEAELERVKDNLNKISIIAPFQGVITKKHKELGEWAKVGEAVVEIINIEKILVHTSVSEKDMEGVTLGQSAEIAFDAFPDKLYRGSVKEIIPQADIQSRTFPLKIEVDNKDHKLYAGMFARIKLITGKNKLALLVPKDAIIKTDNTQHLFVIKDSVAHQIEISIGREKEDLVEVLGDIKANDEVVVTNNEILRDKIKVTIAPGK